MEALKSHPDHPCHQLDKAEMNFDDNNDNEDEEIIYSSFELIIEAAGLVVNKRRRIEQHLQDSYLRTALFCIHRSGEEIYAVMGPKYF